MYHLEYSYTLSQFLNEYVYRVCTPQNEKNEKLNNNTNNKIAFGDVPGRYIYNNNCNGVGLSGQRNVHSEIGGE